MNAAGLQAYQRGASALIQGIWPGSVNIEGVTYHDVTVKEQKVEVELEPEILVFKMQLSVRILHSYLPVCPKPGVVVIHKQKRYEVKTTSGGDEVAWLLRCLEAEK